MFESIIIIIFIMFVIIYVKKYKSNAIIVDAFDNNIYSVNDLPDAKDAANILAKIMETLNKLIDNIINSPPKNSEEEQYIRYVKRIKRQLPSTIISENLLNNNYTSYSVNKGDELVFCIRNKTTKAIHNLNELLYVAIHEIAHIGCPEIGHTDLFKKFNKYLLEKACCLNLYKYIDYNSFPVDYCGILLSNTILDSYPDCKK